MQSLGANGRSLKLAQPWKASRGSGELPLMATRSTPPPVSGAPSYTGPFITVTALFSSWFITTLNMRLCPLAVDLQPRLRVGDARGFAFFLAYFVFSVPTARLIEALDISRRWSFRSLFRWSAACCSFAARWSVSRFSFPPSSSWRWRNRAADLG